MKWKSILLVVMAMAMLMGCKRDIPVPTDKPSTGAEIKQSKDKFLAAMDAKMKDLDEKIDQLAAKSANYRDDAKARADQALVKLRDQRAALGTQYDKLKQATQDGWEKTRAGFQVAWGHLEKDYENAKDKFN